MKTTWYAALLMLIISVSACKKETTYTCKSPCSECEEASQATIKLCREDYASNEYYEVAQDYYEAQGYSCATSSMPSNTETADSDDERRDLEDDGYVCTAD